MNTETELPDLTQQMLGTQPQGPSPEHIRSMFERYGEGLTRGDTDAVVALFAADAVVCDPIGSPAHRGIEAVRRFYQSSFDAMGGGIDMKLEGAVRIAGREAAAAYIARTVNHGEPLEIQTLDVMSFDDAGLITSMIAYWGSGNVRKLPPQAPQ